MANTTGASLGQIYTRLNSAPEYHPLQADTFGDWAVEAGDQVTVSRDGTSYKSPVHQTSMNWRKGQQIKLSSTGGKQRSAISRMSQKKYTRSGSSLRSEGYWHKYVEDQYGRLRSGLELTASSAYLYSKDFYSQMESGLYLTASSAHLYSYSKYMEMASGLYLTASSAHLYSYNRYKEMASGLKLTASSANLYSYNKYKEMSAGLKLTASSALLYVDSKYDELTSGLKLTASSAKLYAYNRTKKAEIIARINEKGESEALINAENIKLSGGNIKLDDAISITNKLGLQMVWMRKTTYFGSGALFSEGITIPHTGDPYILDTTSVGSMIKTVSKSQDGKTLTLTQFDGTEINFSRATTITQSWDSSGNNKRVKATADFATTKYFNVDYRFNASSGQYYIEMFTTNDQGSTTPLTKTSRIIKLGKNNNQVQIQDSEGTQYSSTPVYNISLQNKTVTSNSTVTADEGYDGLGNVTVNVTPVITQSWDSSGSHKRVKATAANATTKYFNVDYRFNASSGQYYIEMYTTNDQGSTTPLADTSTTIKLGKSGNQVQIQKSNGSQISNTPVYNISLQSKTASTNGETVTADAGYDGLSSVYVNVPQTSYYSRSFNCISKEQAYPGSSVYIYKFQLEGVYSMFSAGGTYDFYRTGWW